MRNGPRVIAWDIVCPSSVACDAVQRLLDHEAALDAAIDVEVTSAGMTRRDVHRLGDYFQTIRVQPPSRDKPCVVRVIFERLPNAGRYWRDLMVRVLRSASTSADGTAVTMAYRIEDEHTDGFCGER